MKIWKPSIMNFWDKVAQRVLGIVMAVMQIYIYKYVHAYIYIYQHQQIAALASNCSDSSKY